MPTLILLPDAPRGHSELFEVSPTDPVTFTVVTIGVTVVALVACLIPTRRAMSVDPTVALRYE